MGVFEGGETFQDNEFLRLGRGGDLKEGKEFRDWVGGDGGVIGA